jgi:alkanesulfonate monooxygenase SsuD/methylene tetrahydromethanopterin reductase-like flavin-dependent oxidoreductase (luciferase family)
MGRGTVRGLGLAAVVAPEVIESAAARAESAGYGSFWLNNPPGADALSLLGGLAARHPTLQLGVGVIPLSHQGPDEIVRDLERNSIPQDHFYLGIGSGGGRKVAEVAEALRAVRAASRYTIVLAALGPKMCRLAGAEADAVLLNWLTPEHARKSIGWLEEGAQAAGRPLPRTIGYVRVALGPDAGASLVRESANYEAIPSYADHFRRMGVNALGASIRGDTPDAIQASLVTWEGVVDELVVRAITANNAEDEVLELIAAAAPR